MNQDSILIFEANLNKIKSRFMRNLKSPNDVVSIRLNNINKDKAKRSRANKSWAVFYRNSNQLDENYQSRQAKIYFF